MEKERPLGLPSEGGAKVLLSHRPAVSVGETSQGHWDSPRGTSRQGPCGVR